MGTITNMLVHTTLVLVGESKGFLLTVTATFAEGANLRYVCFHQYKHDTDAIAAPRWTGMLGRWKPRSSRHPTPAGAFLPQTLR